jgi:hypothetical protein
MTTTPDTTTDRRRRDEDPLRLTTENLHRLDDEDLSRVVGGRYPVPSRRPSFR